MRRSIVALVVCVLLGSADVARAQVVRRVSGVAPFGLRATSVPAATAPVASPHVLMLRNVAAAAFSPDGKVLLTVSEDDQQVHFWDAATGEEANRFGVAVTHAVFCADGGKVLTRGGDGIVRIFDARTGKALRRLEGGAQPAQVAAISADGSRVLTAAGGPVITLWDAATGQAVGNLEGHALGVAALAFSPDGRQALSVSGQPAGKAPSAAVTRPATAPADVTLRLWDLQARKAVRTIDLSAPAQWVYFSNDGGLALVAGNNTTIYDLSTGQAIRAPRTAAENFPPGQLTPDRKTALRKALGQAALTDAITGEDLRPLEGPIKGLPNCNAFSADGSRVIMGTVVTELFARRSDAPGTVYIYDVATGKRLAAFDGHAREVIQVGLAPGGAGAFSRDAAKMLFLWTLPK